MPVSKAFHGVGGTQQKHFLCYIWDASSYFSVKITEIYVISTRNFIRYICVSFDMFYVTVTICYSKWASDAHWLWSDEPLMHIGYMEWWVVWISIHLMHHVNLGSFLSTHIILGYVCNSNYNFVHFVRNNLLDLQSISLFSLVEVLHAVLNWLLIWNPH